MADIRHRDVRARTRQRRRDAVPDVARPARHTRPFPSDPSMLPAAPRHHNEPTESETNSPLPTDRPRTMTPGPTTDNQPRPRGAGGSGSQLSALSARHGGLGLGVLARRIVHARRVDRVGGVGLHARIVAGNCSETPAASRTRLMSAGAGSSETTLSAPSMVKSASRESGGAPAAGARGRAPSSADGRLREDGRVAREKLP